MLKKNLLILFISYYLSKYLVIDRIHYDIDFFPIESFKQERYRCLRYIDDKIYAKAANADTIDNESNIIKYIKTYPNAKCRKYKKDYIEYIINKNKIIIYNTLIHIIFYINLIIFLRIAVCILYRILIS
jgi:hypothetical protein